MTRLVCCALLIVSSVSFAGPGKRRAEAEEVVWKLAAGEVNVNQATARLGAIGEDRAACDALLEALRKAGTGKKAGTLLVALGAVAVPSGQIEGILRHALHDEDISVRLAAIHGLARMKAAAAVPELEALAADRLVGLRRESAKALGSFAQPRSAAPLLAQAKVEDDPEARAAQLMALGRCGDKKTVPELEKFLTHESESARLAAAQALCLLGSARGQAFAKGLLASKQKLERLQGVRLFSGAPEKVAAPLVKPMLQDPEPQVKAAAARVLFDAGEQDMKTFLVLESAKAQGEQRLPYENELEALHLRDDERAAILTKAGVK